MQSKLLFIALQQQNIDKTMSQPHMKDRNLLYTRKKIQNYSYGLSDQIGKGYSSKVYRGRNDNTNENIAIKVIDLKLLKSQINRALLDSEIQLLKQLKNLPNILTVHDIFTTKNNTYIITQLCDSELAKKIKRSLSQPEVYAYMQQLVKGYLAFQSKGIIHRDLKPANLLLTEQNQLKIADFGFGIKAKDLKNYSKYNVGSPLYMAPESLRKNQYSFKSDIWAIGVIFYEMLLNDTPWRAKSQKDLLRKIQTEPIQSIMNNKKISALSKQFLMKTLKVDKNLRMDPQQLQVFSFQTRSLNILGQKILNGTLNKTFKSQDLGLNSQKNIYRAQVQMSLQKHKVLSSSNHKSKGLQNNQSIQIRRVEYYTNKNAEKNPDTFRKQKQNKEVKAVQNQNFNKQTRKMISKVLISEVHFCRFLYKLMQKMKESISNGLLAHINEEITENLLKNYTGIIKEKIQALNNFRVKNYIGCQGYEQYKSSSDFDKILKISKQYLDRYRIQLKKFWFQPCVISPQPTNQMIRSLYQLLQNSALKMANPDEQINYVSKEVIILDYLVTSQQLIEMIKNNPGGYQKFAKKSRIEEIVEGKTVDIHFVLYKQIMQRVRHVMEKSQYISFGGDLCRSQNLVLV